MPDYSDLPPIDIPLTDLLPQKAPMLLIGKAFGTEGGVVASETTLGREHELFIQTSGVFGSWILLELMAQTIGIYAGLRNRAAGSGPHIGFILGTRSFTAAVPAFRPGETIRVTAECLAYFESELPSQFECVAYREGAEVGRARLTVYQPEKIPQFS